MQKSHGADPVNSDPHWVSALYCTECVQVQKSHGADSVNSDPHWVSALATLHNTDLVCTGSRQGTPVVSLVVECDIKKTV